MNVVFSAKTNQVLDINQSKRIIQEASQVSELSNTQMRVMRVNTEYMKEIYETCTIDSIAKQILACLIKLCLNRNLRWLSFLLLPFHLLF